MKILLIGGGGREHALAWKLRQSPLCTKLYAAPGNAGIAEYAECAAIAADDVTALVAFAREKGVEFVVVGPEVALVAGVSDAMQAAGIPVFGPSQAAARLEGSKGFMKDLCAKYGVPTAAYGRFTDFAAARAFIEKQGAPIVVKADGLAAGKGVVVAQSVEEAVAAARDMLQGRAFGAAGQEIVVEEFLDGEEVSFFALADGKTSVYFASAQDHKRVGDGDTGPNTGGMGVVCPAPVMDEALNSIVEARIIKPVIEGMAKEGCPFTGVLFAGLMIVKGVPILLEFNTRFGDPECQTLMMRLDGDLAEILYAGAKGELARAAGTIRWREEAAVCVVMAAKGYPGPHVRDTRITGIEAADALPDTKVFHAGTGRDAAGQLISTGGRVLGVTARGADIAAARARAYAAVAAIDWPDGFCRTDIGLRAEKLTKKQKISIIR